MSKEHSELVTTGCLFSIGLVAALSFIAVVALLIKLILWAITG